MTERELDAAVRHLVQRYGLTGWSVPDSRRMLQPGMPDWIIVGRRVLWRELKSADGQTSSAQTRAGYLLRAAGGDYGVWRPADLASGRIARELARIRR